MAFRRQWTVMFKVLKKVTSWNETHMEITKDRDIFQTTQTLSQNAAEAGSSVSGRTDVRAGSIASNEEEHHVTITGSSLLEDKTIPNV